MISTVQSGATPSSVAPPSVEVQRSGASPEARLLALMVYSQLAQCEGAETSVALNQNQLAELRRQVREALEEAKEANDDSGFWGDIGDVLGGDIATLAGMVAIAAAAVATGGVAAAALAAVAIGCSLASKYGEELGLPPKVALCIGLVAVAASIAAGNVGAAAQVSNAATAGAGAAQATRLAQVAGDVAKVAKLVQPAATGAGAVANGVSGYYASEALQEQANARASDNDSELVSMNIDDAIALLGQAIERQASLLETGNRIVTANQNADRQIIQSFSGVA